VGVPAAVQFFASPLVDNLVAVPHVTLPFSPCHHHSMTCTNRFTRRRALPLIAGNGRAIAVFLQPYNRLIKLVTINIIERDRESTWMNGMNRRHVLSSLAADYGS
jgi:hypothetical protein